MTTRTLFRQLVESPDILMMVGVPDALSARLAQQAGFKAVALSGYSASASRLGAPDVGLLTMTEMADYVRRVVGAVEVPVLADGDNGHGNATNVMRTMREFERAGAAAVFFEDQVLPKRCGHMSGKQVIPADEMVAKIKAAVDARVDPNLSIMARTDALGVNGVDDAIERMQQYLEAGADMSFVESPTSVDQMRRITREIKAPNMANMVEGGRTPNLTAHDLQGLGYAIVVFPTILVYTMARALQGALAHLQQAGTTAGFGGAMQFEEFNRVIGLEELRQAETRLYGA
jgi:2,3-dimethylmalate lyase